MTTAFFVQNNYVQSLTASVAEYARANGIALEDRSSSQGFDPDKCGIAWSQYDLVLPYGSVQFLRQVKKSSLAKYVPSREHDFAVSRWAQEFGNRALNGSGALFPASAIGVMLAVGGPQHIRPDMVEKAFTGGVYDEAKWDSMVESRKLPADTMCWISPLREIFAEWRCWVVGGEVIEISQYRQLNAMKVERTESSLMFMAAQTLADVYVPTQCVVLDMALTNDGYKIIEFNPINCSGWYAADVDRVLKAWMNYERKPS